MSSPITQARELWLETELQRADAALNALERDVPGTERGDRAAVFLESVGALLLARKAGTPGLERNRQLDALLARGKATLDAPRLAEYQDGLRIGSVMTRFRRRMAGRPDSHVIAMAEGGPRPSPAVVVLETRQHLEQQVLALSELGLPSSNLRAQLDTLDTELKADFPLLLNGGALESARTTHLEVVCNGNRDLASWWWIELEGIRMIDVMDVARNGLSSASPEMLAALRQSPALERALFETMELADFVAGYADIDEARTRWGTHVAELLGDLGPLPQLRDIVFAQPPANLNALVAMPAAAATTPRLDELLSKDLEELAAELPTGIGAGVRYYTDGIEVFFTSDAPTELSARAWRLEPRTELKPEELIHDANALLLRLPREQNTSYLVLLQAGEQTIPVVLPGNEASE